MDWLWLDIETTGSSARAQVIELAAIRTSPEAREVKASYQTLIELRPGTELNSHAMAAHKINVIGDEFKTKAVPMLSALERFTELAEDTILCGHNVGTDRASMMKEYRACDLAVPLVFHRDMVDTMKIARGMKRFDSYKLFELCAALGIEVKVHHRAGPDVGNTVRLYRKLKSLILSPKRVG